VSIMERQSGLEVGVYDKKQFALVGAIVVE
jgi:hypothetical protein